MWRTSIINFFKQLPSTIAQESPKEDSFVALIALRIGVCSVLLLQAFVIYGELFEQYGQWGIVQKTLNDYFSQSPFYVPRMQDLVLNLQQHWGVSYERGLLMLFALYGASLTALLLGQWPRVFAFLAFFLHFALLNGGSTLNYGLDRFAHIFLFYFLWMPINGEGKAWSGQRWWATLCLRLVQGHLCLVYLQAGLAKSLGEMWWNGEAIWHSVMSWEYRQFDFSFLAQYPWVPMLAGWATLVIEIFYPLGVFHPRLRPWWVLLTLLMHLGIGALQGLWLFAFIMMVLTASVFVPWQRISFPFLLWRHQQRKVLRST